MRTLRRIVARVLTAALALPLAAVPAAAQATPPTTPAPAAQPARGPGGLPPRAPVAGVHFSARHDFHVDTVAMFDHPWSIAWLPNGDMLVSERPGRLRIVRDGKLLPDPVAGVPKVYRDRG